MPKPERYPVVVVDHPDWLSGAVPALPSLCYLWNLPWLPEPMENLWSALSAPPAPQRPSRRPQVSHSLLGKPLRAFPQPLGKPVDGRPSTGFPQLPQVRRRRRKHHRRKEATSHTSYQFAKNTTTIPSNPVPGFAGRRILRDPTPSRKRCNQVMSPRIAGARMGIPYVCTSWTWPGDPDDSLECDSHKGHELRLDRLNPDGCTGRYSAT